MKILHILRGLEQTSGISAFLVENANRQVEAGHDVALLYERIFEYKPTGGVKIFQGRSPWGIPFVPEIVHIHAVWSVFSVLAMLWCMMKRIAFVVSPHGCLMPSVFDKGRYKKIIFYRLAVRPLMMKADAIHVTAKLEADAIRKLGFKQPVEIISLGVDVAKRGRTTKRVSPVRTMLFVGRIGVEKGLINLLRAWRQIDFTGWRLVIVGPDWKGYKSVLDKEIMRLNLSSDVLFPGSVVGEEKAELYCNADCFVLPSPMENFSAVVLEALAHGLPVIATKGTPWNELEECGCGWWIDQGVAPLADVLQRVLRMSDEELSKMGERGVQLVRKKYLWETVANATMGLYEKIINKK